MGQEAFILMRLCECGTLADAIKVAERLFVDTAGADCPVWALQVATAFRTICVEAHALNKDVKRKEIEIIVNAIAGGTRKSIDATALMDAATKRNEALHG